MNIWLTLNSIHGVQFLFFFFLDYLSKLINKISSSKLFVGIISFSFQLNNFLILSCIILLENFYQLMAFALSIHNRVKLTVIKFFAMSNLPHHIIRILLIFYNFSLLMKNFIVSFVQLLLHLRYCSQVVIDLFLVVLFEFLNFSKVI